MGKSVFMAVPLSGLRKNSFILAKVKVDLFLHKQNKMGVVYPVIFMAWVKEEKNCEFFYLNCIVK